jgi:hypothetical protein
VREGEGHHSAGAKREFEIPPAGSQGA